MHLSSRSVRVTGAAAVAGALVVLSGCGGSSGTPSAAPTPTTAPAPTETPCPGAAQPSHVRSWPQPVPADLPKPPSATQPRIVFHNTSLKVVGFSTRLGLKDSVLFILNQLPPAGFVIGRGDAEPTQADAPFTRQGIYGQVRINVVGICRTRWLVAIGTPQTPTSGSPLLPQPSGPASPVPFGSYGPSTFGG